MDTSRIHHATETFARDLVALITQSVLEDLRAPRAQEAAEWPVKGTLAHKVLFELKKYPVGLRNGTIAQLCGAPSNRVMKCLLRLIKHGLVTRLEGPFPFYIAA